MMQPAKQSVTLKVYKTNLGLFLKSEYPLSHSITNYKINGKLLKELAPSENNGFMFLKDVHEIISVEKLTTGVQKVVGYILKIAAVANEEIPLKLSLEEVQQYYDEVEEEWKWTNYQHIRDLYKSETVKLEDTWEQVNFQVQVLREFYIENYEEPIKTTVTLAKESVGKLPYGHSNLLQDIVQYSDIVKLLTPEMLLHTKPCALSSTQVFQIVRQYVKENIDRNYSRITSDYDFCFTVKKVFKVKPYVKKIEIYKANGKRYSAPKFKTENVTETMEEVFNIAPKAYSDYNVAPQWEADSLKDMAEQVKVYLDNLMEVINSPLKECACCGGTGIEKEI